MSFFCRHLSGESATRQLGAEISIWLRRGDFVALEGGLGAGKTTLARAVLRCLADDSTLDVPSPTFTLVQIYDEGRLPVGHFDFYRLTNPEDVEELSLDEVLEDGAVLAEWPSRLARRLPEDRLEIRLEAAGPDDRIARLTGMGTWKHRLSRRKHIATFIDAAGWGEARRSWLEGDASTRSYEHLTRSPDRNTPSNSVLMNWPIVDEPQLHNGKTYRQLAHLAQGVEAFLAIGEFLRSAGLSAPGCFAAEQDAGLLLLEDLGDQSYQRMILAGEDMDRPYEAATAALARLHQKPPPTVLPIPGGGHYEIPVFDLDVCLMEIELLTQWAWPAVKRVPCPEQIAAELRRIWAELFSSAKGSQRLMLRDFHSPNLFWLPGRQGAARAGIIDHQDANIAHPAYDVVSLAQDARVNIDADREEHILSSYLEIMPQSLGLTHGEFRSAYAVFGAQRAVKLLGLFTRLNHRDNKPGYLAHIPRVARYLERNLDHTALKPLKQWFETHFGVNFGAEFHQIGTRL